jgi:hypothetical protein
MKAGQASKGWTILRCPGPCTVGFEPTNLIKCKQNLNSLVINFIKAHLLLVQGVATLFIVFTTDDGQQDWAKSKVR